MLSCLGKGAWHIISRWLFVAGDGGRFYVCWSMSWKMKGGIWGMKEVSKNIFLLPSFSGICCFLGCWFGLQRFFRCCTFSSQLRRIQITLQTSWSHEGFFILWPKEAAKFLRHVAMYQCTIDIYMTSFSKLIDFHPTFRKIHTRRNAAKPPSWRNPAWHLASQAMNLWQSPKVLIPLGRRVIPWLQAQFFFWWRWLMESIFGGSFQNGRVRR